MLKNLFINSESDRDSMEVVVGPLDVDAGGVGVPLTVAGDGILA